VAWNYQTTFDPFRRHFPKIFLVAFSVQWHCAAVHGINPDMLKQYVGKNVKLHDDKQGKHCEDCLVQVFSDSSRI
jgi:hypothetical protein